MSQLSASKTTGLLEREDVLAQIEGLVMAVAKGTGSIASIIGRPGEGKTALLGEACVIGARNGLHVCRARGSDLESEFALGVARQLLEPSVQSLDEAHRADLMQGAAGLSASALDLDINPEPAKFFSALHGLYWLLAGLAAEQPLLLAIDDAQWADPASLQWLAYLNGRIEDVPVLVVLASRTAEQESFDGSLASLSGDPQITHLPVDSLGLSSVEVLIERILGAAPHERFATKLHEVTAGNPFGIHELLGELERRGVRPDAEAAAYLGAQAPESLRRNILARLARLQPTATSAAQSLSVLGDRATPQQLATLAQLDSGEAASAIDALAVEGMVDSQATLCFAHPLGRTAVYDSLPARRRAQLHGRAAKILAAENADPEAIAAHLLLCDPVADAQSVVWLLAAATAAMRRGAPTAAVTYLERALAEPPLPAERATLLAQLGQVETLLRSPAAVEHLQSALESSNDPQARAHLRLELSDALFFAGHWDRAVALLIAARDELGASDPELSLRLETKLLTLSALEAPSAGLPEGELERLLELAREDRDGARALRLTLALLFAVQARLPDQIAALVENGLDGGRFIELEGADAIEATHAAVALLAIDRVDDAVGLTEQMLTDAAQRGSVLGFLAGSTFRAFASVRAGALTQAEGDGFGALELAQERGLHFTIPFIASYLALALIERGRAELAAELLLPIMLPPTLTQTPAGLTFLEARGRVHRACLHMSSAIEDLRACGAGWETLGVRNPNIVSWRSELALALAGDSPDEARELVSEELELARVATIPRGIGVALRAAASIATPPEREELLNEAITMLKASRGRLELAGALVDLGAHLRREGQRVRSREPLGLGLDLAQRCQAEPLATRALEELQAAGARPRRPWQTGVQALTPSELRVARMAATGRSNQEVAQALFITTQTVKGHLGSAYRKLGITARGELADALKEPAPESPVG